MREEFHNRISSALISPSYPSSRFSQMLTRSKSGGSPPPKTQQPPHLPKADLVPLPALLSPMPPPLLFPAPGPIAPQGKHQLIILDDDSDVPNSQVKFVTLPNQGGGMVIELLDSSDEEESVHPQKKNKVPQKKPLIPKKKSAPPAISPDQMGPNGFVQKSSPHSTFLISLEMSWSPL